jgi:hypothetical protein
VRRAGLRCAALLGGLALGAGCRPSLDDRPWLITRLQTVGWTAEPPEAPPGGVVSLQVVALEPAGAPDTAATTWTLCRAPKPLSEERVVAAACLDTAPPDATGDPVQVTIPSDACALFGPDVPQPAPGAPPTRPHDADATGGYYQPLTIALGASLAVGLQRITCGLPGASLAAALAFRDAYRTNQNPIISALDFTAADGAPVDPGNVTAGERVTISAGWPAGSAEGFPIFDAESGSVLVSQEALRADWYVTGGTLDRAAAEITDAATLFTATAWTAPVDAEPTTVQLVLMLRDSRGGSAAARATLTVAPAGP